MKVAASPQIYIGDALKWYSSHQSLVTSHSSLLSTVNLSTCTLNLFIQKRRASRAVLSPTGDSHGGGGYGGVPKVRSHGAGRRRSPLYEVRLPKTPAQSFLGAS